MASLRRRVLPRVAEEKKQWESFVSNERTNHWSELLALVAGACAIIGAIISWLWPYGF